jgi:hypothetical protein
MMANILSYDALLRMQDRDLDGALADCRGIINAEHLIGDEPTLISVLVRVAMQAVARKKIERILAQGQPSEKALAQMQKVLEAEIEIPLLLIGARGERANSDRAMQALQGGTINPAIFQGMSRSGSAGAISAALESLKLRMPGAVSANRASLLRLESEFVEIAKLPVEEQVQKIQALTPKYATKLQPLVALLLPAIDKVAQATFRTQAELRCMIALLAAERYRQAKGRWPAKLEDLVPEYLSRVPIDPYDGKLLRLRLHDDGLIIYSIGPDGEDNQGKLARGRNYTKKGTDLGSQLWNVGLRRLPYRPSPADRQDQ